MIRKIFLIQDETNKFMIFTRNTENFNSLRDLVTYNTNQIFKKVLFIK